MTHQDSFNKVPFPGVAGEQIRQLSVVNRAIEEIRPSERNARTHDKKQIDQIAASIREFGFTNPVLIDAEDRIIAGHGRVDAARNLGYSIVPTIRLEDMSETQRRAYIIADNRLAENAGWDREILATELQFLVDAGADFDLTLTGFDTPEIDLLFEGTGSAPDPDDDVPALSDDTPPVSKPGDLWQLGKHRLLCGDATVPDSYATLLQNERAEIVFTDPPYNVPIDGHVSGLGANRHEEFGMASGEMTPEEFTDFLRQVFANLAVNSIDGSMHFICMDWRHIPEITTAAAAIYSETKNVCVWNKDNGGMGSLYRSKHELVFVFKNGTGPHINNVELGRHGRNRTNVWDYPGVSSFGEGRAEALAMHPTVKPVQLVADAILDCSGRNGTVLDAFVGSGTTILAAEKVGRQARGIELDPRYVDVSVTRWETATGAQATEANTGLSFQDLCRERRA